MRARTTSPEVRQFAESLITDKKRRGKLLGYAFEQFRLSRPDAEDLLQEAICRLLRYEGYVRDPDAFVFTIFRNLCRRFKLASNPGPGRLNPLPDDGVGSSVEAKLLAKMAVREGLSAISRRCRQVLKAYYLHGMDFREVARAAQLADSSAAKTINRCLRRLRECFE